MSETEWSRHGEKWRAKSLAALKSLYGKMDDRESDGLESTQQEGDGEVETKE